MGGEALFYLVSIGVPPRFQVERIEALYKGMQEVAEKSHVLLIGGDTCSSQSGLVMSITAIGRIAKGKACLRSGASPGDAVYVTGTLGESALGLECLRRKCTDKRFNHYLDRHRNPTARLDAGSWLSSTSMVTSMIDVSDGLLADLGHIAESSNVGFEIHAESLSLTKEFRDRATELHLDPLELALTGGEDYELAFTIAKDEISNFELLLREKVEAWGHVATCIGWVTDRPHDRLVFDSQGHPISFKRTGYDHFYKP
jgi:thiamine-monophosphate kinase